jgi:hypothetical protein
VAVEGKSAAVKVTVSMTVEVAEGDVKQAERVMVVFLKRSAYNLTAQKGTIRVGRRVVSFFDQDKKKGWR